MDNYKTCVKCGKQFDEPWWYANGYWCESCVDENIASVKTKTKRKK